MTQRVLERLLEPRVTMALPATIALVAALVIRDLFTAAVIVGRQDPPAHQRGAGAATERMARDLAVDEFEGGLMPHAKRRRVQLLAKTPRVATVGDGLDDGPALTGAAGGVAYVFQDLLKCADTLRLARRTHAIILQNVLGTVIVDGVGIALAAVGVVTPVMAAALHVTSALAVILNGRRTQNMGRGLPKCV